jgi:hypothetical protein
MKRIARRLAAGLALVLATLGAAQLITDGELQKVMWSASFPNVCGDVRLAVNGMRSKPTTNPAALHQFIAVVTKCGTGSFAAHYEGLYNLSVYTASAAALLAARHEGAKAATGDAQFAVDAANIILGVGRGRGGDVQSPYAGTAQRIKTDAHSLLASLSATAPAPAPAASAPAPVST